VYLSELTLKKITRLAGKVMLPLPQPVASTAQGTNLSSFF